jgi:quinol monooxygenase YgiN
VASVAYLIEMTIQDGKVDEFKEKAAAYTALVKDGEQGTLEYQWWLSPDGSKGLLKETFDSSESLLVHLANVGPALPDLLAIAPFTRWEVYGEVSAAAREALDPLGAKYFDHVVGFDR